jgi:hypothetical protein
LTSSPRQLVNICRSRYPINCLLGNALLRWQNQVKEEDSPTLVKLDRNIINMTSEILDGRRYFIGSEGHTGPAVHKWDPPTELYKHQILSLQVRRPKAHVALLGHKERPIIACLPKRFIEWYKRIRQFYE